MLIKKVISAAAALIAAGALAFSVFGKGIGTAGVYSADVYWDVQFWGGAADAEGNMNIASVTNAEITGDGIYTASIKFAYPLSYGQYFALGTSFKGEGEGKSSRFADYPDAEISILSVKADGVEIKGSSVPDVNAENSMRVYIYNPWADDSMNYAEDLDWTQGITEIEVKFEITGLDKKEETAIQTEAPVVNESESAVTTVKVTEAPKQTEVSAEESESAVTTVKVTEAPLQTEVSAEESEPAVTTVKVTEAPLQTEVSAEESEPAVTTVKVTEAPLQTEVSAEESASAVTTVKVTEAPLQTEVSADESAPSITVTEPEDEVQTGVSDSEDGSAGEDVQNPPASDESTASADTGNYSADILCAAMALSAAAAVLSGKRK
ncbi:MAG: hypothetical protein IJ007_01180 [Oscillospiraceae bacterium]|nr:hypothetical protein [Oscillospiraceae bacterium]